ncbi:MAG: hypothetical protein FD174_2587 [Geobacteraceae bacterium]|nr:MAG: hypothetical protein FD174_2587 [Geobacteraceae bacterium]
MAKAKPTIEAQPQQEFGHNELSAYVKDIFDTFKTARAPFEERWRECQLNYLGQYQEATKWRKTEGKGRRSKIFIKLTTLKCNTAHSRIIDAFLSGRKNIPFDVEAINAESYGISPDDAVKVSKKFKSKLEEHFKLIEASEKLNTAVLECAILGTAVLKGPIVEAKEKQVVTQRTIAGIPVNQLDKNINPYRMETQSEMVPTIDHIPLWEYYVDPNAKSTRESIGEIHFQRILPTQFMRMGMAGGYNRAAVKEAKRRATSVDPDDLRRDMLGDNWMGEQGNKDKRVSVIEYWGLVPVGMLRGYGVEDIPEDLDEDDCLEALVVLAADGIVVKACLNPLGFRPFYVSPYKKIPHQIYGEGVAGLMRDSQKMINSAARLIIDNKALSGNGVIAMLWNKIDWKRTGSADWYPGKVYYFKDGTNISEAIQLLRIPDVTQGLRELLEMFERFADEETGIPKYTSGDTGSFLNKTATGISMLMTAANVNLKSVMQNIDDYWIEPIVEGFYQWFMEMGEDQSIKIPLKIKATGADSLMAKEIKLENLLKAKQVTNGTPAALFIDDAKFWREVFYILEIPEVMRPDDQIDQIIETAAQQASQGKDLRELLRVDVIFPLLSGFEQAQVLEEMGIQPDPKRSGITPQVAPGAASTAEAASSLEGMQPGASEQGMMMGGMAA